jgi:hypothetical protein
LENAIRRLKIQHIKAQANICELSCQALDKKLEVETLTEADRSDVKHRLDTTVKEWQALIAALGLLEKHELENESPTN